MFHIMSSWNGKIRWREISATVLAIVLIPAVPVSALTFLTPWVIKQSQSHGAPPAVTVADAVPSLGSLLVNMGVTRRQNASSSVSASRMFHVGPGAETISIGHTFETLLRDAMLKVTIKIMPSHGFKIRPTEFGIRPNPLSHVFGFSRHYTHTLPEGDYTIRINIKYKNHDGIWDNSPPHPGSPHTFSIQSI